MTVYQEYPRGAPTGAGSDRAESRVHRVELHGHQISYREAGRHSGGPVVLLVHGLASSSATWRDVLPVLGRRAHVLAPDLLGSGQSAKPAGADYSVGAHAARLRDLLRALGLFGASVATLEQLAVASLRALMLMLLAWMILESLRALFAAVMTFSDRA